MNLRISAAAFCLFAAVASAQTYEIAPVFGVMRPKQSSLLGSLPDNNDKRDDDTKIKHGQGYGVRFTLNTRGYYGFEGMYMRARHTLEARVNFSGLPEVVRQEKINVTYGAFNVLAYMMPPRERFRPFLTVGLHTQRYGEPNFFEWTQGSIRTFGGNFGGGVKVTLTRNVLLRVDFRDYIGGKPYDLSYRDETRIGGGLLQTLEGTIGLSIAF